MDNYNKKRILIVDDDEEIRELLEFDIAQSGYIVDTAKDGLEGLNKALNNSYDLILLDVMMPKMNGFDVCKNIRQAKLAIPILMLTAKGTIEDKTDGFDNGADDYLVKPFDIQEVLLRIRVLLRRNQVVEENPLSNEVLNVGDIQIFPDTLECTILNKRVKKLITSHIGLNPIAGEQMNHGEMEVELVPMGTFAERIRCGGSGLGGILTPTGVGTIVAEGKQVIQVRGRDFLLEEPLHADVAVLKAWKADKMGNLVYHRCARNYNPMMAMAADLVIVEAENIVEVGEIDPDMVMTPGVLVDMIVHFEEE